MKKSKIIVWIILLVAADQISKIVIAGNFLDTRFDIIDGLFGFRPVFNAQYSYFNQALGLNIGLWPHVVLLVLIELILIAIYGYYRKAQRSTKLIDIAFAFGQAALVCVLCGFFFWKRGVLDFIFVGFVTCDLKDIYINCFVALFIINSIMHAIEVHESGLKFTAYIKERTRSLFRRSEK